MGIRAELKLPFELIYRTLEDGHGWQPFLKCVLEELQYTFVMIATVHAHRRAYTINHHSGLSPGALGEYTARWLQHDPFVNGILACRDPRHAFAPLPVTIPDEELVTNDCWREFLGPQGVHYGAGAILARDESQATVIYGGRPTPLGPLTTTEIEWFAALLPHLARAVTVCSRMANLQARLHALSACLDSTGTAMVVVSQWGDILFANGQADAILASRCGLRRERNQLRATNPCEQGLLETFIQRSAERQKPQTMVISRPTGQPLLLRAGAAGHLIDIGAHNTILWIVDPAEPGRVDPSALRELFGLTPAEAELCIRLARGCTVQEAARSLHVSLPTVRTHLAHALAKTGTRRQPELVAATLRVAGMPCASGTEARKFRD